MTIIQSRDKNSGETVCINCHPDVNQSQIKPEYMNPVYYGRSDVKLGGKAVNCCNNEDTANDPDKKGLDNDNDLAYDMADPDCRLFADIYEISAGSGGVVNFNLYAGPAYANRKYFLLGSVTGTSPGFPLPGGNTLPLNWDVFTGLVFKLANSPALMNFHSAMDAGGTATAQLNTFGPLPPAAVGATMYFAFLLYQPYDFVSGAVGITITT